MSLSASAEQKLEAFVQLVEQSPHNLVSKRARAELRSRHVPECVAFASLLPSGDHRLLDVGSGGGFPGLVIAIVRPELDVHLLDGTRKKADFLRGTLDELEVTATVHQGRAEELSGPPLGSSFDLVTARAVAPLAQLISWTVPFLRIGGLLYAVKGARWQEELVTADARMRRAGARVVATPDDMRMTPASSTGPRVVMITRDR